MPSDFDARASTWDDDPAKRERARVAAAAIRGAVPLDRSTRLLEYGAGTGLVTEALASNVGAVTLADPSHGMRQVLEEKVAAGRFRGDARVWDLDLATDPIPDERFDVVVTVMTLHHIPDLAPVLRGFARLLEGGGYLCIVDLDVEDGSFHEDGDFDGHHGFARAELGARLRDVGFGEVRFDPCHVVERDGRDYPLFLATTRANGTPVARPE